MPNFFIDSFGEARRQLEQLRERLLDCATLGRVFNATRVLINPATETPDDLTQHWEEFLGRRDLFGFSAFRIPWRPRIQHFCFIGSRECLDQFTGLAASAVLPLPMDWFAHMSPNPADWDARTSRDQWLVFLYRLALRYPNLIPVERPLEREGESNISGRDRGFFDPLAFTACYDEIAQVPLQRWLERHEHDGEPAPRYVFSKLALDVCACSIAAIEWLLKTPAAWPASHPQDLVDVATDPPNEFAKPLSTVNIKEENVDVLIADDWGVRFVDGSLRRDGFKSVLQLTVLQDRIFKSLLKQRGSVCSFDILGKAWPIPLSGARKIHTEIHRLNEKLKPISLQADNERKMGYRLVNLHKPAGGAT